MKTISGRFVTAHNGKAASCGNLNLELISLYEEQDGEEQESIVPLGELAETLKVPIDAECLLEWREEQKSLGSSDEQIAADEAIEFKQKYDIPESYDFCLDGDGRIPIGAQVIGNDELSGNTSYRATVTAQVSTCAGFCPECFHETLRITGDDDLNEIASRKPKVDPDAHLTPRERELMNAPAIVLDGTMKLGKKNRIGFFAGSIHCPTGNAGGVSLPAGEHGIFGVFPFSLPFAAVVNYVSVLVDTAAKGTATIGIYDASGLKRCEASIDLSCAGRATGIFPSEVNLSEGDYFLAWVAFTNDKDYIGRTDKVCNAQLRSIGIDPHLFGMVGIHVRRSPDTALPDTLSGSVYRSGPTFAPILVHFRS